MKFAKELEQDLVPEWRTMYFDYKTGKKKVKSVARAFKHISSSPHTPGRQLPANLLSNALHSSRPPFPRNASARSGRSSSKSTPRRDGGISRRSSTEGSGLNGKSFDRPSHQASPIAIPQPASPPDRPQERVSGAQMGYGSFVPSPENHPPPTKPPSLELPDPALPTEEDAFARHNRAWRQSRLVEHPHVAPSSQQAEGRPGDAYQAGKHHAPSVLESSHLLPKHKRFLRPRRMVSTPHGPTQARPHFIRRLFSHSDPHTPNGDVPLEAFKVYEVKQAEFFGFLDDELHKIEKFYKSKEAQSNKRLQALRDQLHEMRDRRMEEVREEQEAKKRAQQNDKKATGPNGQTDHVPKDHHNHSMSWMKPLESAVGIGPAKIGKTSKALQKLGSPSGPIGRNLPFTDGTDRPESWRDFTRRPPRIEIPYRAAKRKLKLALQEFYRGLELLKSYALLNRTAFRKINKKYDKVVKARPTQRYMTEKVNKAWFVQSEVLDHQLVAVEDLYARYFERGNHKVAVGKLRSRSSKSRDFTGSVFRSGMLLAGAAVFGVQGIVYGGQHLTSEDETHKLHAGYLLQIYGGYFLMLFLFLLFCIDCKIWNTAKINYPFIFEFDARHNLDWHQLSELPCLLLFLLGLTVWLNFQPEGGGVMYLYWPVILIGVSIIVLFNPLPILYHRSRHWWAYSNFRLLLAGIYPVEFRDFFLGDMYCSQTYAMGNLSLFFCLYAHDWVQPGQCNSSNSRLLGFFSTLPGIWRALQCLRRYYDTRNVFPHLVNGGKYSFTILSYMTLSLYRINPTYSLKALFIACSTINAIYCSIWDLAMDWSLLNPYAPHPFLRDVLGYKRPSVYYAAMILDPILRFNWIFYAIYGTHVQHSALLSFLVSLSEICRRGIWSLFRVENEHCTNVGRFRASRDVPLPYDLPSPSGSPVPDEIDEIHNDDGRTPAASKQASGGGAGGSADHDASAAAAIHPLSRRNTAPSPHRHGSLSATALEAQHPHPTPPSSSLAGTLRRRATLTESDTPIIRGIARAGTAITRAHAEDFERRRPRPGTSGGEMLTGAGTEQSPHFQGAFVGGEDSEEEDEGEEEEEEELRAQVERDVGGEEIVGRVEAEEAVAAREEGEEGGSSEEEEGGGDVERGGGERSDPHGGAIRRARDGGGD